MPADHARKGDTIVVWKLDRFGVATGAAAGSGRDAGDRHDDRSAKGSGYESPAIAPRPSSCTRTPAIAPRPSRARALEMVGPARDDVAVRDRR